MDPIGFLAGDVNLYRYVFNGPMIATDPLGLWDIERDGGFRAPVTPDDATDTWRTLANEIGLKIEEINQWLTGSDHDGTITPDEYDKTFADEIRECPPDWQVPNSVLMFWSGDLQAVGRTLIQWTRDKDYLKARGFLGQEQLNDKDAPWTAAEFVEWIGDTTASKKLHGTFIWAHGNPISFGTKASNNLTILHADVVRALKYRLGLVIHNFCHGGWKAGAQYTQAEYWDWDTFTKKTVTGTVTYGGKDWSSLAPGHKFFGKKGILYPVGFFNPGQWGWATLTDFRHVEKVLAAGEQGTKE